MTMFQPISHNLDRVMATLIAGLELEFGRGAAEGLAQRFIDAEDVDFHWEARIEERWIGSYEAQDEDAFDLDRVAILGQIDGRWFVAMCIVDGDGMAHGIMGRQVFSDAMAARKAFETRH
jgi:hypothetical protein